MGEIRDASVTSTVWRYMREHPGVVTYAGDISKEYNLHQGSVQTALGRMTENANYHVERISRGAYVYRPNAETPLPVEKPKGQVLEMDAVSAYPPVLRGVEKEKVEAKTTEFVHTPTVNRPTFEFLGFVGTLPMVKDKGDKMWVCVPLRDLLTNPADVVAHRQ